MINQAIVKASTDNIFVDLSHRGLLKVSGEDAVDFLQGQLTNDIKQLDHQAQLSGYCSPKGRLLALFYAFQHNGDIHLEFDADSLESIAKRLCMFVLRAKVTIDDVSDTLRFGIAGETVEKALAATFPALPKKAHEIISQGNTTIVRIPSIKPAFQIITDEAGASTLKAALAEDCAFVDYAAWDWLETQSAIPQISMATKDAFVPQMVNLDTLDGINFKKGCYTGQEIVARTHYLGKVKRRTMLANLVTAQAPSAGDQVLDESGNNVGQIVRVSEALTEGYDVLFEARLESIESNQLQCNGSTLTLKTMPYTFDKTET